jgi:hypothetical protein
MSNPLPITKIELHLEYGPYAWPGGYPLYFIASDGEALSFEAVKENIAEVRVAHAANDHNSGWLIVAVDTNWEDENLTCSHSGKSIECAYPADNVT